MNQRMRKYFKMMKIHLRNNQVRRIQLTTFSKKYLLLITIVLFRRREKAAKILLSLAKLKKLKFHSILKKIRNRQRKHLKI